MGFRPCVSIKGVPSFIRHLPANEKIGYGCLYETTDKDGEWIVTIAMGYGDGYPVKLSNKGKVIRDKTGIYISNVDSPCKTYSA